jgi:deazaflavin-dependent oxidoreductase (nitroreductase family)
MPSDLALKAMNLGHRIILKASFGKLGWKAGSMPVLELTTIGRKSGQARSVMLTSPIQRGDEVVVVASRGGDDHHPAWFLNLRDQPEVEVAYAGAPKRPYLARVASSEERAELWPTVEANYQGYAGYQRKTEREIPLVLLTPR